MDAKGRVPAGSLNTICYLLLVKGNPDLSDRIGLGEVNIVSAGRGGIPLEVELRIK